MEGAFDTEKLTAAVIAVVFVAAFLLLVVAIRRARKARRREIELAGEERPLPSSKPKRPALRAEDVVPQTEEEEEEEAEAAEEKEAKPRAPTPAPAGPETPEEARKSPPAEARKSEPALSEAPEAVPQPVPTSLPDGFREVPRPTPAVSVAQEAKIPVHPLPRASVPEREQGPAEKPVLPAPPAPIPQLPVDKPTLESKRKKHDARALAPGLARTRAGWISRLGQVFSGKREIDPTLVEEIEKVLLTADIGVRTSQKLLEEIRTSLSKKELSDPAAVWQHLRKRSTDFLRNDARPVDFGRAKPFVLLTIGVNGSGKTTTIGKLASKLREDGRSVLLAAGDTFRAAATEQLEVWGHRVGTPVVRGKEGGDPSSVIFDGIKRATAEGIDVVIADTAGRLHTKANLMDELQKVRRVAGKAMEGAPHETWLVIDATSGQNAIAQAQIFTQAMSVTGIVLTKLDGTAKGGVILGIADQLGIPVRYIGVGERVEDLREFDADEFVEALFEDANPS
jgi:fused signal recognition particle receptor